MDRVRVIDNLASPRSRLTPPLAGYMPCAFSAINGWRDGRSGWTTTTAGCGERPVEGAIAQGVAVEDVVVCFCYHYLQIGVMYYISPIFFCLRCCIDCYKALSVI
jgi:hypothetical protein